MLVLLTRPLQKNLTIEEKLLNIPNIDIPRNIDIPKYMKLTLGLVSEAFYAWDS